MKKACALILSALTALGAVACSPKDIPVGKPIAPAQSTSQATSPADLIGQSDRIKIVARIEKEAESIPDKSTSKNTAYVFFDPRCTHCADMFSETRELGERVHFVWIPVSLLGEKSRSVGAGLLQAQDRFVALQTNELDLKNHGRKSDPASASTSAGDTTSIDRNTNLLATLVPSVPVDFVPFTIIKKSSGAIDFVAGYETREILIKALGL